MADPAEQDLEDLFGGGSDDDEQQQQRMPVPEPGPGGGAAEEENLEDDLQDEPQQQAMDDDERELFGEDEAPKSTFGEPIHVAAPLLPRPKRDQLYLLKLTNILGLEPRAFDRSTYQPEETVFYDSSGFKRVRLRDSNVIRWRYQTGPDGQVLLGPDGQPLKESNARLIRWSDGSETLQLGGEMLDVARQNITQDNAYCYAVRYDIIEAQAQLGTRVVFQPTSLKGGLHKKLKERVAQHSNKELKVRYHVSASNPEVEKAKIEKEVMEQAQARARAQREMNRYRPTMPRHRPAAPAALTADFLEEDEYEAEEEAYGSEEEGGRGGMSAAERARAMLGGGRRHYDEQEEAEAAQRLQNAKRQPLGRASEGDAKRRRYGDADEEVEAVEAEPARAAGIKVRRGVLLDDDDDD